MNLTKFAKEVASLKKTFMNPDGVECLYIDKQGNSHPIQHVDAAYWGTKDNQKLRVLIYEETPSWTKELPF
jgi:hypothetical protein